MLWSFLATEVLSFNYLKILAMEDHTQPMVTSAETTVSWILGKLVLCEAMGLEYIALYMKKTISEAYDRSEEQQTEIIFWWSLMNYSSGILHR